MKSGVALIIPYFGKLPPYFPYFVESLRHISMLDVLLFTDATVDVALPENLKVLSCTLGDFNTRASDTLGIQVAVKVPYKVCDLRPAFGVIFAECLSRYRFWAFGDMDLVYGALDRFVVPMLPDYDVVSFRKGWTSGSLCLLRNCASVNSAYRDSKDWRNVFSSPEHQLFDEMGGHFYSEVLQGADLLTLNGAVDSFTHVVRRLGKGGHLRCRFSDLACEHLKWGQTIRYDRGHLTESSTAREIAYVHWVAMKRRFFVVPPTDAAPEHFYIRNTGLYLRPPSSPVTWLEEGSRIARRGSEGIKRLLTNKCRRYVIHGHDQTAQ